MSLTFQAISHRDTLLAAVIALGDKNSKTLGMLPEGAFLHHAKKKTIIVALDGQHLAGYILFRISQRKRLVSITHLCIHENYRSKGVSAELIKEVKKRYEHLFAGISLTCREDYKDASRLWEKFGFKPVHRKRSRSKEEHFLIKWLYDFGNPDLFTYQAKEDAKVKALLDCSVLIPLSEPLSINNTEAHSLHADWLQEEVEFVYAQEIFNELNRDLDKVRAAKTREFLKRYDAVKFKPDDRDDILSALENLKPGNSSNDISDRKQLAECVTSGVTYFITLDRDILDLNEELFKRYSLQVLRPADFILLIDEITNTFDYHSLRLAGANYETGKIKSDEIEKIVRVFWGQNRNERKSELRDAVIKCSSDPKNGIVRIVKDSLNNRIASYGVIVTENGLYVEFIRILKLKISLVLFQQLIKDLIILSLEKSLSVVIIKEDNFSEVQHSILSSMGFQQYDNAWKKISLSGLHTLEELSSNFLIRDHFDVESIVHKIQHSDEALKEVLKLELERKLWPAKISQILIPVYIIPIKPLWASQLFDYYIANSNLFGSRESLTWSRENVYYRSVKPVSERAPGRILWYLSSEDKSATGRNKGIVACSYLDEVYVDRAKDIFQKLKHYGVYEWADVYKLAKGQILSDIKALKFSDTEVFEKIVSLDKITQIMLFHDRPKNSFASPVEVSIDIFNAIYKLGTNE